MQQDLRYKDRLSTPHHVVRFSPYTWAASAKSASLVPPSTRATISAGYTTTTPNYAFPRIILFRDYYKPRTEPTVDQFPKHKLVRSHHALRHLCNVQPARNSPRLDSPTLTRLVSLFSFLCLSLLNVSHSWVYQYRPVKKWPVLSKRRGKERGKEKERQVWSRDCRTLTLQMGRMASVRFRRERA